MSESGNGAHPRPSLLRSASPSPDSPDGTPDGSAARFPGPVPPPPARRRVLAAGAGAAALLGVPLPVHAAAPEAPSAPAPPATPRPGGGAGPADPAPYAPYWFPDSLPHGTPGPGIVWRSLRQWTPESDPDLAHNTATVPLAARFTPVPPHPAVRAGQARIAALVSFGPTAQNPSQGVATADTYALTHWAYIDELVFWGGSAGEGIVLAPNAPVVDAAHRNGVPVLGNVFLPPVAYGGDLQWTRDLVQRDALGRFPMAEQLVRVAVAYGFDGWFVNAETDGGDSALATRMREFLRALRAAGAPHNLRITWYDAMNSTGRVGWQGALNPLNQEFFEDRAGRVADTVFVDFRWTARSLADSAVLADRLGRSRHELWAAVDTESRGWESAVDWEAIVPRGRDHVVSYGFYRPEWTRNHLTDRSPAAFHRADDRFWTGESLDPARPAPGSGGWRAPATVVADRSTVAQLPFACSFNTGHGERWYERGEAVSDTPWSHLGLQDRLPGRRWVVDTAGPRPSVTLDFARAWRGGSSLLVAGRLSAPAAVGLHGTRLALPRAGVVEVVHSADPGSAPAVVEVGVAVREPAAPGEPVPYAWFAAGTAVPGAGWRTARVGLSSLAGRTAYGLAVRITARGDGAVSWRVGALSVRDGTARPRPSAPRAPTVDAAAEQHGTAAVRLSWRRAPGPVRHYELHRLLPDGSRRFLGGTCGTALYLPAVGRAGRERAAVFEVRAVDELYAVSAPARTALAWAR
ncbi:endo-beta-N-acetylglucosaminidase [Streptomyces sp. BR123]|uniref:endo-beta-N-acetylglucosaminidase n=1 Tax=Streptomyces sp. BR123 TaxID=2749828 RepID=UPI0015C4CDFC|nr:endo-beta-N-acetylglucosaminidase [Streptomyces sp. BR123]NXY96062.1 endo-beta-N-acetylglucosaminidase [Streptomyces sp. BR123]